MLNLRWRIAQALEIRWWKGYLKGKDKAEYLDWKRQYWTTFLEKIDVAPQAGERILDAGCGPAGIFLVLNEQEVVAVDPLLEKYEQNLPHFQPNDYPYVHFITSPLERFTTPTSFEPVFCLNAINHVNDLTAAFDALVTATQPGGKLIISIDAHNYRLFQRIFQLIPGDVLHPHQYNLQEYQAMLTERDCTIDYTILYKQAFFFNYYVIVATKTD